MKYVKFFLASFVLLAIASAFITPKSHVQPKNKSLDLRTQVCVNEELAWTGNDNPPNPPTAFVIPSGTTTTALRLKNPLNWPTAFQTLGNTTCSGITKVCKATISYCYDPANGETDPLPATGMGQPAASIQNVINAIYNNYVPSPPFGGSFPNPITFTVGTNPVVITVTIIEKS